MTSTKVIEGPVTVKSEDRGEIEAVFATLGVIDRDGDVTLPGAFDEGAEVDISAFGHAVWKGGMPVGLGTIRTTRDEAVLRGRFFMETTAGRDHFALVKARGTRQAWSYGFDVLNPRETATVGGRRANVLRRLKVHEVSPVWQGAGVNTRTLTAKGGLDIDEAQDLVRIRDRLERDVQREELAEVRQRL